MLPSVFGLTNIKYISYILFTSKSSRVVMTYSVRPLIRNKPLQRLVYDRLRNAILDGKIQPGAQIKAGELASELKVSTVPVREALRQLEAEGLVTFQPNKRITVNRVSETELYDLYFVMIPLELFALEKCFDNLDKKRLNGLDMLYAKMIDPATTGEEWIDLNWLFHTRIHEVAGSPRLTKTLRGLRTCIKPYFYLSLADKDRIMQANKEHEWLLEAIQKGDRKKARRVLHQHLLNGQKAIGKLLKDHA